MAVKRISKDQLIEQGAIEGIIQDMTKLEDVLKQILKTNQQILKANPFKTGADVQAFNKARAETTENAKALEQVEKRRIKLERELEQLRNRELDDIVELNERVREERKLTKDRVKEERDLINSYEKKTKRLREVKKELKDSIIQNGKASKSTRILAREFRALDREVREAEESAGEFQRNVGKYPKFMGKAANAVLGVAAAITAASAAATGFKGSLDQNEEGSQKLTGVLGFLDGAFDEVKNIAGGAASAIIDIGTAIFEGTPGGLIKAVNDLGGSFDDAGKKIFQAGKTGKEAAEELRQITIDNRDLERALDEVNAQLAKQQALAGDQTKSFNQIEQAANRATLLEVKRAEIQEQISQRELDRINNLIAEKQKTGQNVESLLDDQLAAELAFSQAKTEIDLALIELDKIRRENARDRFERELDFAIDAFDSQKTVNERLVLDETKTFQERAKIFERTVNLSESAFEQQQKLVEDFVGERLFLNELVNIDDERIIRERLRRFELDDVTFGRILEIIREQKIARQDLADLERDLNIEAKERAEEQIDIINQIEQAQIKGRIDALKQVEGKEDEVYQLRRRLLIDNAEFEISKEENTAEQIELIRQELANELAALEREDLERQKQTADERIDRQLEYYEELKMVAFQTLDAIDSREQARIDGDLERTKENIDQQQRLAERGLANTLAFEQQKAAKLEAERERLAKRAEKRQKTLAYLTAFTEYLKQDPNSAAGKALAQVAIAETVSGFFHEGTEEVGKDGGTKWRSTGKDDYLVAVHKGERIMTAEQNRMVGDLSNEDLANIAYYHRTQGVAPSYSAATFSDNQLQKLSKTIAKSIDISIDTEGFVTRKEFESGIRKIVKFKPTRRI